MDEWKKEVPMYPIIITEAVMTLTDINGGDRPLALYVPARLLPVEGKIEGVPIYPTKLAAHAAWPAFRGIPMAQAMEPVPHYQGPPANWLRAVAEVLETLDRYSPT